MHVSRGVNNNFLLLQRIMWGRAVLHWGSVKPAWRTSSQWFSSSSTSSWRQWQGSWSTRPSLTFWTKSTTPSCLSPTKKWTCFLLQVGMKKTHTGPWLFLCVRPLPLTVIIVTGIALYLGGAQLLNCRHHFHHDIPPLVDPGKPQEGDCMIQQVTYYGPFTNQTEVSRHNHLPLSFFFKLFSRFLVPHIHCWLICCCFCFTDPSFGGPWSCWCQKQRADLHAVQSQHNTRGLQRHHLHAFR